MHNEPSAAKRSHHRFGKGLARRELAISRGDRVFKKFANLDSVEDISCAAKARLIAGLRQQYKLADLLRIAGWHVVRSVTSVTLAQQPNSQCAMEPKICDSYEEHKGRYTYRRITAAL